MSKQVPDELEIPDGVAKADEAVELIRAWIADGTMRVSLQASAFGDRMQDWGRLLAEIGQHAVRASVLEGQMQQHEALHALIEGFDKTIRQQQHALSGELRGRIKH
jgi:hypothetical protein